MKNGPCFCLFAIILLSAPGTLPAQDYEYHPALSDRFTAIVGAFRSSNAFNVEADVLGDPGEDIDFDDSLNVSDSSTFLSGQIRWKFSKKKRWSLAGQYFSNDATGETVLTKDVEWDGYTFREGSFVNSGVKLAVTRLFIGRSFILNDRNDIGVTATGS